MATSDPAQGFFTGQLLTAMPNMPDPRFARTVIYMCAHSDEGALGLVVNKLFGDLNFEDLLDQVGIEPIECKRVIPVHSGGPVEAGRGFVLHSKEFTDESTMIIDDQVSLTASIEILRAIAAGAGPRNCLLALGYSGWGPGQLELEIHENGWLNVPADEALIFDTDLENKWQRAIAKIGVDFAKLSPESGRA
ncbi:MAG TPA: YqgE/AlgH family protein [Alphaproteobacteria bacterium]|nr:YqgE/AlgH family protein [Alphaproteobacteria bacterium]